MGNRIEVRWRLVVAAIAAVGSLLVVGNAQGATPRVPGPAGMDLVKPTRYTTLWTEGVYDETVYRVRNLRWQHWGKRVATGRGRLTHCVAEYERCHSFRGVIQFRKKRKFKRCGGPAYPYYTEFRVTSGHGGKTGWIRFLDCARVPKGGGHKEPAAGAYVSRARFKRCYIGSFASGELFAKRMSCRHAARVLYKASRRGNCTPPPYSGRGCYGRARFNGWRCRGLFPGEGFHLTCRKGRKVAKGGAGG